MRSIAMVFTGLEYVMERGREYLDIAAFGADDMRYAIRKMV